MKYIVSIIFFCVTIQSIGQAKVWMRFGDEALQEEIIMAHLNFI